ncbi:sugar-binding transcriptional regulator [Raineyella sp. W15-4]|uniref:sugar-binding transcriptional regulator n=1 Tax=Raineyella sp. W15-4 TaxID=3081651 RepID=UPI002954B55B|nr:sugar-binding domain-containing protein [Raineyella sp. W15-4]WOQ17358.1 sugar-binding domain-containing protein [Raineyella sp. W15-4]
MDDEITGLITRIAHLYYDDDVPKSAIAQQLGISRFKVARLLQQGRDEGIITIEIRPGTTYLRQVSHDLARHLGLSACLVVPGGGSEALERDRIAQMTANLVQSILRPNDSFGFSWGRTMLAVSQHLTDLPPSTIAQLTGTVGNDLSQSPLEILRGVAGTSTVNAHPIFAPLFAGTVESAAVLRADPAIAANLARFRDLSVAVMSIGSWSPPITQLREYLSPADTAILDAAGARAEMLGLFLDEQGRVIDGDLNARRIAATPDDLLTIPYVIAAAGDPAKAPAIRAVASSGLVTTLITDDRTALRLSELPPIHTKAHTRHQRRRSAHTS